MPSKFSWGQYQTTCTTDPTLKYISYNLINNGQSGTFNKDDPLDARTWPGFFGVGKGDNLCGSTKWMNKYCNLIPSDDGTTYDGKGHPYGFYYDSSSKQYIQCLVKTSGGGTGADTDNCKISQKCVWPVEPGPSSEWEDLSIMRDWDNCSKCAPNSCDELCKKLPGNIAPSSCAYPGSTNPDKCCNCTLTPSPTPYCQRGHGDPCIGHSGSLYCADGKGKGNSCGRDNNSVDLRCQDHTTGDEDAECSKISVHCKCDCPEDMIWGGKASGVCVNN